MIKQAVFLDRDGVINRAIINEGKPYPPKGLIDLEILPGVKEAMLSLHNAGYLLIVVTNQPDVARGAVNIEDVKAINHKLSESLPIDIFRTCFHDDKDKCKCRKPLPGMLVESAKDCDIDLSSSYMVGDRWRDIKAGKSAGCKTFFIDYGYDEQQPDEPDFIVHSLLEAVGIILGEKNDRN
jgi:D-glycero-D-manno-heptose 1,7-bisphosphate phosphatase